VKPAVLFARSIVESRVALEILENSDDLSARFLCWIEAVAEIGIGASAICVSTLKLRCSSSLRLPVSNTHFFKNPGMVSKEFDKAQSKAAGAGVVVQSELQAYSSQSALQAGERAVTETRNTRNIII